MENWLRMMIVYNLGTLKMLCLKQKSGFENISTDLEQKIKKDEVLCDTCNGVGKLFFPFKDCDKCNQGIKTNNLRS